MMGSPADVDSVPIHRVTIAGFEMLRTPVTFGQYRACVAAGACAPENCPLAAAETRDDEPVVCVTWVQARDYARWIGGRLPSEAEWEYAAKGAGSTSASCGDEDRAPSCRRTAGAACARPVCSHPDWNTPQGLCDMAGDAWEWVEDWYHDSYAGAPADGRAWVSPPGTTRVSRLGSWKRCRGDDEPGSRDDDYPEFRHPLLGFRAARSVP
jgi:formylglycine-generating enzyme required for sulfatase activity